MKKYLTIELEERDYNDFVRFCDINGYDENKKVKQCFAKGYNIEKYGLLSESEPKIIEKEVIKEIIVEKPVEVIKEIEVIKEVIVEKPVEIIKEIEVPIKQERTDSTNSKITGLYKKIIELEREKESLKKTLSSNNECDKLRNRLKDFETKNNEQKKLINEKDEKISHLKKELYNCNNKPGGVTFLRSSNLKF